MSLSKSITSFHYNELSASNQTLFWNALCLTAPRNIDNYQTDLLQLEDNQGMLRITASTGVSGTFYVQYTGQGMQEVDAVPFVIDPAQINEATANMVYSDLWAYNKRGLKILGEPLPVGKFQVNVSATPWVGDAVWEDYPQDVCNHIASCLKVVYNKKDGNIIYRVTTDEHAEVVICKFAEDGYVGICAIDHPTDASMALVVREVNCNPLMHGSKLPIFADDLSDLVADEPTGSDLAESDHPAKRACRESSP